MHANIHNMIEMKINLAVICYLYRVFYSNIVFITISSGAASSSSLQNNSTLNHY